MIECVDMEDYTNADFYSLVRIHPNVLDHGCTACIDGFIEYKDLLVVAEICNQGELIPKTNTSLDADNYLLHEDNLNKNWIPFLKRINSP